MCILATLVIIQSKQWTTKALIRLCEFAGWFAPLLFAYGIPSFSNSFAHNPLLCNCKKKMCVSTWSYWFCFSISCPSNRHMQQERCIFIPILHVKIWTPSETTTETVRGSLSLKNARFGSFFLPTTQRHASTNCKVFLYNLIHVPAATLQYLFSPFLFWFGFYGLSRLFHSFWAEPIARSGENGRKTSWPLASRTWLVSHVTRARLEPTALRWRVI